MIKLRTIFILLFPVCVSAQQNTAPLHYWRKPDSLILEQASLTFELVNELLSENRPSLNHSLARRSALMHLDALLHDTRIDESTPFLNFIRHRIEITLADLQKPLETGMKIFKLYNHSFIVKTKDITLAFDLIRGGKPGTDAFVPDSLMRRLVAQCDILFVSHEHADHADPAVAGLFAEANKTVVVPPGLWAHLGTSVQSVRSADFGQSAIQLSVGKTLKVIGLPGHQDKTINNMYVVTTPSGLTVAHTGDQWSAEDMTWIANIHQYVDINVLLVHCWAMPLADFVNGFAPALVITGHENEMTHGIDHREPYWLNENRMKEVNKPTIYMTWGEHYHVSP